MDRLEFFIDPDERLSQMIKKLQLIEQTYPNRKFLTEIHEDYGDCYYESDRPSVRLRVYESDQSDANWNSQTPEDPVWVGGQIF